MENNKEGIDFVRVQIPLNGTSEAEAGFELLKDALNSNPEVILRQIVEPVRTILIDGQAIQGQSDVCASLHTTFGFQ